MKVKPKKHLGQHFLKDLNIASKIVDSLTYKNYDTILEIGPGTGVLTQFLLNKNVELFLSEIDDESVEYLKINYPQLKSKIVDDFLKIDIHQIVPKNLSIIGNFPYNISSQIIFKVLENKEQVVEVVGMFQKEVAERIVAEKGSKIYGILSVLTQAYYKTEYLFTVHENVFNPPPKVKSAVIRLSRYREQIEGVESELFIKIVKAGFNQRRKTLRNALKVLGVPLSLHDHEFLNLRAEQLSVEDFIQLTQQWQNS
ncbi:16S rRNA (adenine(1518)-N(6)/adenine(1519)-N(6))-dimethyltransferase RsmA [Apibacter muscae]|uniref:Ribosomal RNA small subunit methyltransferase A n=1 Tax=Apibacter muscae TaxID=2509004 RepID=A0A563DGU1_9FLAO|nr:16S rRNA (adenine(1518)-N(6)/adenine(1519)-N(6))-dimethyltransferase RsmA [Apibacter muscae]TWP29458.1 16S rRNA (adenine(1518)-N(6)/adenine(1519)-N(6))-dimethyltransferase RsmA [Apibacter muscae]